MTTHDGKCCGNCDAFMVDRFDDFQGACANITDHNIDHGCYSWTTKDGDCQKWEPRKVKERVVKLPDGQIMMELES